MLRQRQEERERCLVKATPRIVHPQVAARANLQRRVVFVGHRRLPSVRTVLTAVALPGPVLRHGFNGDALSESKWHQSLLYTTHL